MSLRQPGTFFISLPVEKVFFLDPLLVSPERLKVFKALFLFFFALAFFPGSSPRFAAQKEDTTQRSPVENICARHLGGPPRFWARKKLSYFLWYCNKARLGSKSNKTRKRFVFFSFLIFGESLRNWRSFLDVRKGKNVCISRQQTYFPFLC